MGGDIYQAQIIRNFFDTITGTDRNLTRIYMCVMSLAKLRMEPPDKISSLVEQLRKSKIQKELSIDILDYMCDAANSLELNRDVWGNTTNLSGLSAGVGDISVDPMFFNLLEEDYRLQAGSPLLTAGSTGGQIGAYGAGGLPVAFIVPVVTVATTAGSLVQNKEWSGVVEVTATVTVPQTVTLSIAPGTVVKFADGAGLVVNEDNPVEGDSTGNIEASLGVSYSFFTYDYPKTNISTTFVLFPSLNVGGRRTQLDVSISREIITNFTVWITAYDSYDSKPPAGSSSTHDFGMTLSVGWTF